ncbi:MAG: hypothetical protein HOV80_01830 [Polyangiaceae bacterium]|nr:hypothetical protein [Polyangiaceae bacterium]
MRSVLRAASLSFALLVLGLLMAQASGCVTPAQGSYFPEGGGPAPAPSSEPFDDDLSTSFMGGTKCATIRVRRWTYRPGTLVAPREVKVEAAANEVP